MLLSTIARLLSNNSSSKKKRSSPLQFGSLPRFEQLEDRVTPATVSWTNPSGGSWEIGSNWNVGHAPEAGDDVVIQGVYGNAVVTHSANGDSIRSLTTDSNVTLAAGSLTISGTTSITSNLLKVQAGATLNFANGASVLANTSYRSDVIGISVAGTLNADTTTFGVGRVQFISSPYIQVLAGGRAKLTNSTFAWSDFNLANGSLLSTGDISGNIFAGTVTIPVAHAPLLTNNLRFQSVAIQSGTLTGGQNITLSPLGTETQTTQKYVFNSGSGTLTIAAGATLNILSGTTLEAELSTFDNIGIVVNGTLNINGSKFTQTGSSYGSCNIEIKTGGRLKATTSTFGWTGLSFANGSLFASGDITRNTFNQPISIPVIDAPILTDNLKFSDVYIQSGNLTAGQNITLAPLGSDSSSQRYVFGAGTGTLNILAGATLNIANRTVLIGDESSFGYTCGINVSGTLIANGADFRRNGTYGGSFIQVNAGGRLKSTGSTFAWSSLSLANGSLLSTGDISGNAFDLSISIPLIHAPLLADNLRFQDVIIQPGSLTSGQNVTLSPLGTATQTNQRYVFNKNTENFAIESGASLSVSIGTTLVADESLFGYTFGISVSGTLNLNSSNLSHIGSYENSFIKINNGGRLVAKDTSFDWSALTWDNGSKLNGGDITNNIFNQSITIPAADAVLLANNQSFEDVFLNAGKVGTGQIVTLDPLGTVTRANQRYIFNGSTGNFIVEAGSILNISTGTNILADESIYGDSFGFIVNGLLNVAGANFAHTGTYGGSFIQVNAGGHLKASNSTFDWSNISLENGSILNQGDIVGNGFDQPIAIPAINASFLSDNRRFQDVRILPGSLMPGQSATLAPLGTDTTATQRYLFASGGNFTVQAGAILNILPDAKIVSQETFYSASVGIIVNGVMNVRHAKFSHDGTQGGSFIQINNGGRLISSDSNFDWSNLILNIGSILNSDDIKNNTFDQSITIPASYASRLAQNSRFEDVNILPGGLAVGDSVTLSLIGTSSTANQRYVFNSYTGIFTIPTGAVLNVTGGATLIATGNYADNFGIVVDGSLNVDSSFFSKIGSNGTAFVQVNSGGHIASNRSSFGWSIVNLKAGAIADLQYSRFSNLLAIDSAANIDIFSNDFSAINTNSVIATGSSSATIDLRNNFWAAITPTDIAAKIIDHADISSQPTVLFDPVLNSPPYSIYGPAFLTGAEAGGDYSQPIHFGPANHFSVARGSLPSGMVLTSDGKLQGLPTAVGSFAFTVSADDLATGGTFKARQVFFLNVAPPIIQFTQTTIPFASAGHRLNLQLQLQGGIAPYRSFTVSSGALPDGINLSSTGLLQGIPTGVDGIYDFTISAQDSTTGPAAPYGGSQKFTLLVDNSPPTGGTINDTSGIVSNFHISRSTVSANWRDFVDNGTGIASYQWAIGTTPGGADVIPFTDAGKNTSASVSGLNLNDNIPYFISVKSIDLAGNVSPAVSANGFVVDSTPPTVGSVSDGNTTDIDVQFDRGFISANWAGFADTTSGIAGYQWAIGTSPGSVDIQSFTSVESATSASALGLNLVRGKTYFVSVRAIDNVGNISTAAVSNGSTVVMPAPVITGYSTDAGPRMTNITNDRTPTLQGNAEPGSTIRVFEETNLLGTGTANAQGNWSVTTMLLADGPHPLSATATDPNGTVSLSSVAISITVDTVAPIVQIFRESNQASPTNANSVSFEVISDTPVTGFAASAIDLSASTVGGILSAQIIGSGTHYLVTVTGMSGAGKVIAAVRPDSVLDDAGNANLASININNTVDFDNLAPGVIISHDLAKPNSTSNEPIIFHVKFTKPVTGFGPDGIDLSASTVGGSLVGDVSGSGTDYTVTVSGMFGVGDVVLSIRAGAATDSLGNINLASSTGNNVVRYNRSGVIEFDSPTHTISEGQPALEILVNRRSGSEGTVSIHYSTADGSAIAGSDYDSNSGMLEWADGDSSPKTISIPIFDDTLNESVETFLLALDLTGSQAELGPVSTTLINIARNDGTKINGSDKLPFSTFTDSDGDLATLRLVGKVGSLTYYLNNGQGPISDIELQSTDSVKSALTLTVKKPKGGTGDNRLGIGKIHGSGVKTLSLTQADLIGAGIDLSGYVGTITIGSIQNGADISLAGTAPKKGLGTSITTGIIGDGTNIEIKDNPLTALTATSVGIGNITAPSVGTIRITGKAKTKTAPAIPGDFKSNLTVAGTGLLPKVPAIRSIVVAGPVSGSQITVGGTTGSIGDVGLISFGSFVNSQFFAGYTGPSDGSGIFSTSTIGSFNVLGKTAAFSHSAVIANMMNSVSLARVDQTQSGNKFGFIYHTTLRALSVRNPIFRFTPKGPALQSLALTDFEVKKV